MARNFKTGVIITGDSKGGVRATNLTKAALESLNDQQKRVSAGSARMSQALRAGDQVILKAAKNAALFGGILAGTVVAGLIAVTRQGFKTVDALAKTSDKLGIATEDLASLRIAAERTSGLMAGAFDTALQRMTRRLSEAAMGTGEAKNAIKELGLDAKELAALAPDEAFAKIADAMQDVSSQGDRVRLSFKLFDTEGVALVNTLLLGSEGLDEFRAKAEIAGVSIDRDMAAKVEAANDSFADLRLLLTGLGEQLAVKSAPFVEEISNRLFDAVEAAGGMGKIAEQVFNFLITSSAKVSTALDGIRVVFNVIKGTVNGVQAAVAKLVSLFFQLESIKVGIFSDDLSKELELLSESFDKQAKEFGASAVKAFKDAEKGADRKSVV